MSITIVRPNLVVRVRTYYQSNPDEELTYQAIVAKFGCTLWTARRTVYVLIEQGFLESVHVVRKREKGIAKEEA